MAEQENKTPDFLAADVADIADLDKQISEQQPQQQETVPQEQQVQTDQPQAQVEDDKEDGEDRGQFIRKEALYQERKRRKEATERSREYERQLNEERQRYSDFQSKANERLAALFQQAQQPKVEQAPAPQIPDINQDPLGHLQAKDAQREKELNDLRAWKAQQEERAKQSDTETQVRATVERLEHDFAQKQPDYWQAQSYLAEQWAKEAQALGYDPRQAVQARIVETIQLAAQQNKNPAELAYRRAQHLGYKQSQPNGSTQQPVPQKPQQGVNLDTLQRGLEVSKSPSSTPGAPAAGIPTIEALLAMDDAEFAAKYVKDEAGQAAWTREMKKHHGIA